MVASVCLGLLVLFLVCGAVGLALALGVLVALLAFGALAGVLVLVLGLGALPLALPMLLLYFVLRARRRSAQRGHA